MVGRADPEASAPPRGTLLTVATLGGAWVSGGALSPDQIAGAGAGVGLTLQGDQFLLFGSSWVAKELWESLGKH